MPPLVALWALAGAARARAERRRQDRHRLRADRRFRTFIVAGCLLAGPDGKVGVVWPILCFIGMGFAFIWYWPVLLALISLAAPPKVNSTLMGGFLPGAVRRKRDHGLGRQLL